MELSLIIDLPYSEKKRNKFVYEVEKSLQERGYRIISRSLSRNQLLIVYENNLSVAETKEAEEIEKQWRGHKIDARDLLIVFLISCFIFSLTKSFQATIISMFIVAMILNVRRDLLDKKREIPKEH